MSRELAPPVCLLAEEPPRWLVLQHRAPDAPRIVIGPTLRLGSAQDNEVILDGPDIAGRHCTLRRVGADVRIYDHGSRAGTLVEGAPLLEPRLLRGSVRLILGAHVLTVHPIRPSPDVTQLSKGFCPPHDPPRRPRPLAPRRRWRGSMSGRRGVLLHSVALCGVISSAAWATIHVVTTLLPPPPAAAGSSAAQARLDDSTTSTVHTAHRDLRARLSADATPDRIGLEPTRMMPESDTSSAPRSPSRRHAVGHGETWSAIATAEGVSLQRLRDANAGLRRPLREGDRVHIPTIARSRALPATAAESCTRHTGIPGGSRSIGGVNLGALEDPLRMPQLDLYELRCPAHAYATATTARALIDALRCFRGRASYNGQLIIGDISAEQGGPLGPHLSHQSGRDVDLWLPIAGGRYGQGCDHCGSSFCRPQPEEIDWSATWELVDTLAEFPEVEVVFLDFGLQAELRRAALESDANPATLDARIQWPRRGAGALVQHADGHVHHMHVRFRCPLGEESCVERPSTVKDRPPLLSARRVSPR